MSMTAIDMIQNTNQLRMTPASNFVAMLKKLFCSKEIFTDRSYCGFQSFPDRLRKTVTNEIFPQAS